MTSHFISRDVYSIDVRFACPYCQQEVQSGDIVLNGVIYPARRNSERYAYKDYDVNCENCKENFHFSIYLDEYIGYVEFDEYEHVKNIRVDVITNEEYNQYHNEQFDAISSNTHLFQTFLVAIENLRKLNEIKLNSNDLNLILKRQIYTGVIAAMETFLSDTMINITLSDSKLIRNFVETYPDFTKQKFELKDIFTEYDRLHKTIKIVLLDTIYHDLRKVREMYRSTFKIEFPDITEPIKCVLIRHDIVHRNGKSKNGILLDINADQVSTTIQIINLFVTEIAKSLKLV